MSVDVSLRSKKRISVKCPECYEQLASKAELSHHIKTVHDEKKNSCLHCDLKFSLLYTLENHIDKDHNAIIISLPKFGVNENVKDKIETVSKDNNCSSEVHEENHHIMENKNLINHFTSDH